MSRSFVDIWKVLVAWVLVAPQVVVLVIMGILLVCVPVYSLVWRVVGGSSDWLGQPGFLPSVARTLFMVFLVAYYGLPSFFGGLHTLLCVLLHFWAGKQAMAMGAMKWLFAGTFFVSIPFAGYFVWWHFTGQKFGYL